MVRPLMKTFALSILAGNTLCSARPLEIGHDELPHPTGTYECRGGKNANGSLVFGEMNMGFDIKLDVAKCHIEAGVIYAVADLGYRDTYTLVINAAGGQLEAKVEACEVLFLSDFSLMTYAKESSSSEYFLLAAGSNWQCRFDK